MLFSTRLYKKALGVAAQAHGTQQTPHGLPYLVHVVSVAAEVVLAIEDDGLGNDDANLALQCALLHDVIEDTPLTWQDLRDRHGFSSQVIDGVLALSKNPALPTKEAQMADSLRRLLQQPAAVQLVKLADRITNLDPPPPSWNHVKIENYLEEAMAIQARLGGSSPSLARRLGERAEEYQQYII